MTCLFWRKLRTVTKVFFTRFVICSSYRNYLSVYDKNLLHFCSNIQTVAPILSIGSASLVAISTLTSEINFYTRLIKMKDPATDRPLFAVFVSPMKNKTFRIVVPAVRDGFARKKFYP